MKFQRITFSLLTCSLFAFGVYKIRQGFSGGNRSTPPPTTITTTTYASYKTRPSEVDHTLLERLKRLKKDPNAKAKEAEEHRQYILKTLSFLAEHRDEIIQESFKEVKLLQEHNKIAGYYPAIYPYLHEWHCCEVLDRLLPELGLFVSWPQREAAIEKRDKIMQEVRPLFLEGKFKKAEKKLIEGFAQVEQEYVPPAAYFNELHQFVTIETVNEILDKAMEAYNAGFPEALEKKQTELAERSKLIQSAQGLKAKKQVARESSALIKESWEFLDKNWSFFESNCFGSLNFGLKLGLFDNYCSSKEMGS